MQSKVMEIARKVMGRFVSVERHTVEGPLDPTLSATTNATASVNSKLDGRTMRPPCASYARALQARWSAIPKVMEMA